MKTSRWNTYKRKLSSTYFCPFNSRFKKNNLTADLRNVFQKPVLTSGFGPSLRECEVVPLPYQQWKGWTSWKISNSFWICQKNEVTRQTVTVKNKWIQRIMAYPPAETSLGSSVRVGKLEVPIEELPAA